MEGYYRGEFLGECEFLRYFEKDGNLHFDYKKKVSIPIKFHAAVYRVYKSSGEVPPDIVEQGKDAISRYVEDKIAVDVEKQEKEYKKHDAFAKNLNEDLKNRDHVN